MHTTVPLPLEDLPLSLVETSALRDAIDMEFHLAVDQLIEEQGITLTQGRMDAAYERIVPDMWMFVLRREGAAIKRGQDLDLTPVGRRFLQERMMRKVSAALRTVSVRRTTPNGGLSERLVTLCT